MKRMSLAGDVISHVALPGLGLALLFGINPLIGAPVALLLGTLLIWHLQKGGTLTTDVAIGVIFTAALAIGTLVTPSEVLIEALFGGFQNLTLPVFLVGILLILVALHRKSEQSAKGAEYESQGQARSEAERVAPGQTPKKNQGLKGRNNISPFSGVGAKFYFVTRGDALRACP